MREQQAQIAYTEEAHGNVPEIDRVWAGIRRTGEGTSAAGIYGYFKDREGRMALQFRPMIADLDHEKAEIMARQLKEELRNPRAMDVGIPTFDR